MESAFMEVSVELVNGAFFLLLAIWVLVDKMRQGSQGGDKILKRTAALDRKSTVFAVINIVSNALLSISYMGFCVFEFWNLKVIRFRSIFPAMSWTIVVVYAFLAKSRVLKGDKGWPLVLVLWWVYCGIINSVSLSNFLIAHYKSEGFPEFLPAAKVLDIISLPLIFILCINVLWFSCSKKKHGDLEHPLLQKEQENVSHEDADAFTAAGVWSQLTFLWLNPLFQKGRTQKLELPHIPSIPPSETAHKSYLSLEESLQKKKAEASSLLKAISYSIWRPVAVNAVFAGVNTIASYMGPLLINNFVNFITGEHQHLSYRYGLMLVFIFFLSKTVESLAQRQWYFGAQRIGIRIRAALMVMIYKKFLSIKYSSPHNGKVTNFINVDAERIGDFFWHIHGVWLLPLQVFLALVILYKNLGAIPSISALAATVFMMIINIPLANRQERLQSKIMEARDSRIEATAETLKSIRVLKMHSWESNFLQKIQHLRKAEGSWLKRYLYTCSAVAFLFWASPTLVSVITFGVCILLNTPLTPATVLSALATFRILQEPIYNLPELISMIAQTKVSLHRIQLFIREEDQDEQSLYHISREYNVAIEIETGEYAWETSDSNSKPTIKITEKMQIIKGQKIAICGSIGSGKSSLLCSILGEIPKISGQHNKVYGSKAYVPQSAWIQTGTIRENVLFGKEMNKAFYADVLEACALNRDIETWTDGDLSVVGERGMNLSGGQKQRVQLARAAYSDSEVYFLDDPFSAVDAHTGAHLFKKCLMQMLSQKTVLYTTHQLEFLHASDFVLVMKDGRIVESGKYEDLMRDPNGELVRQMVAHRKSLNEVNPPKVYKSMAGGSLKSNQIEVAEENLKDTITDNILEKTHEEETETVLFQGLQMGSNYWIASATEKEDRVSKEWLIGAFALLSGGSSIFILGRTVFLSMIAIETAQRLFLGMINSVFRAPIIFFDSTPSSQILGRASTDQSIVDTDIPYRLAGLAFALIQLFSIIILMSQVAWQVFLLFITILAISIWYQAYYITTARELARMVGVRKAPILHHFSESISGVATIHCFNQKKRFSTKILRLIDDYSRVAFHNSATMEWLSVRINFLFNLVFFLVLAILVSLPRSAIDPSLAGLAATYGLNLNVLQAWVIWNSCNVENKMISVERILQFSNIPSEAPLVIEDCRPQPEWPTNGRIELENLQVRYSPTLPMVLKGITCAFPGGKKIGVVGRTGSGKSTLIQALFRVVEPKEGRILIDGVDICEIGLQDLRSRLSIIPQDTTLFQGTIRMNLDPLQQHSDPEIWEVLRKCRLADIVKQDQKLLDAPVAEDGENWSVGQRQLVCLARVLLQRRRILVLDEATASVDTATDNVIQKTIREETSGHTVITVAHRIPTVVDNDLVLVLDDGNIVEYDSPAQLLKDDSSAFSKLVIEFLRRSSKSNCDQNLT
ncbi:putative ABC transporter C family member 15 isoform X2 [Malania oleifera]|uniref:putative ABC transporter C family member 15 isoform X2 n=1 Tax=Malania oleifera TaxID=397392 RepID=UPI0025AE47F0|nr:putative ABC transporter C family member 15 isoform X2 [Malania oleifera]